MQLTLSDKGITDKVSVIVPSYNHCRYVEHTINSYYLQNYANSELIVIDDGSSDGSRELLQRLQKEKGFVLFLEDHKGLCASLNKGIKASSGEYLILLASDDYMTENRINEQVEFLKKEPTIDVLSGEVHLIDDEGKVIGHKTPTKMGVLTLKDLLFLNRILAASTIFRRKTFLTHGLFNEAFAFEDYQMWLRILNENGKIVNVPHTWGFYRISHGDLEKKFNWYFKGLMQTLEDYKDDPMVKKQIPKANFFYCIKLTLLLGGAARPKYSENFSQLKWNENLLVILLSCLPLVLRKKVLEVKTRTI